MNSSSSSSANRQKSHQFRVVRDRIFFVTFVIAVIVGITGLVALLLDVLIDGIPFLNWSFLSSYASRKPLESGILAPLAGTVWVVSLTAVMTIPIGVSTAIYLEEFAGKNLINRLIVIDEDGWQLMEGNYASLKQLWTAKNRPSSRRKNKGEDPDRTAARRQQRNTEKLKRRIKEIETEIATLEPNVEQLDEQIEDADSSNWEQLESLTAEKAEKKEAIEQRYAEWESIDESIKQVEESE